MSKKITRWASAIGIAGVITLATLLFTNQLRREQSDATKALPGVAEKTEPAEGEAALTANTQASPDKVVENLVRAWNQGLTDEIGEMFAFDGVLIIPAAPQIQSSAKIEKAIREKRGGILKDTTLSNTVENISQPEANRAIVKGTYQLKGINILGLTKSTTGSYIFHQVNDDGRWLISRAELTESTQIDQ